MGGQYLIWGNDTNIQFIATTLIEPSVSRLHSQRLLYNLKLLDIRKKKNTGKCDPYSEERAIKLKRSLPTNKMHILKKLNTTDLETSSYVINLYIGQHACQQWHRKFKASPKVKC